MTKARTAAQLDTVLDWLAAETKFLRERIAEKLKEVDTYNAGCRTLEAMIGRAQREKQTILDASEAEEPADTPAAVRANNRQLHIKRLTLVACQLYHDGDSTTEQLAERLGFQPSEIAKTLNYFRRSRFGVERLITGYWRLTAAGALYAKKQCQLHSQLARKKAVKKGVKPHTKKAAK